MLKIKLLVIAFTVAVLSLFPCSHLHAQMVDASCSNIKSGIITFAAGSAELTQDNKSQLDALAADMRAYPNCRVVISSNGTSSKNAQRLSWDRTNNSIAYMVDSKNIVRGRFVFIYGARGDESQSNFHPANDSENDGPDSQPRPQ